jgi:hypothetical protein
MLRFLRKIRKLFIAQAELKKYMLYAIGEIALVVLGILIALQINNWNENLKMEKEVDDFLLALKEDLIQDTILIKEKLPFIVSQYEFNESLRARIAQPEATVDTLIQIMHHEFNPNWSEQITYNTNAYNSLNQSGLIENLPNKLKATIKNFYNRKSNLRSRINRTTNDYQGKITSYVDTYTFGSTKIHDQGPLIDRLVWENVDPAHLAATFQGISNFKRILFTETKEEMEFSSNNSRVLISEIEKYLEN